MKLENRIILFENLGIHLKTVIDEPDFEETIFRAKSKNQWFTADNIKLSIKNIYNGLLKKENLELLVNQYPKEYFEPKSPKKVGIIAAGNIPLVGFQDIIHVILAGHKVLFKPSSQDEVLINYIYNFMKNQSENIDEVFEIIDKLNSAEAFIATGSGNSSRYFEYYFASKPNVIRKNRYSVAVLNGNESKIQLSNLGNDIFLYFGLGCRNISKIYVPEGYDFTIFFESIEYWSTINLHSKYTNNYDYMKSIYLINREKHLDNGFLLLKEDEGNSSPISVLFYEYFKKEAEVFEKLLIEKDNIQVIVAENSEITFGESQCPGLLDYADGVDTIEFLSKI